MTGLEFKLRFISSREVNADLPKVIIRVTQVSHSVEARQNSLRIRNLICAWVRSRENDQFLCRSSSNFSKGRKSVSQVLGSLRQARKCYKHWYVNFSLASLLINVTKRWWAEVSGRWWVPSPPFVQWRQRTKRKIRWRGLEEKWYLLRRGCQIQRWKDVQRIIWRGLWGLCFLFCFVFAFAFKLFVYLFFNIKLPKG